MGKRVPSAEVWASTLGLLGALESCRTSHFGDPPAWVMTTLQPGGSDPGMVESKRIISARPAAAAPHAKIQTARTVRIALSFVALRRLNCEDNGRPIAPFAA